MAQYDINIVIDSQNLRQFNVRNGRSPYQYLGSVWTVFTDQHECFVPCNHVDDDLFELILEYDDATELLLSDPMCPLFDYKHEDNNYYLIKKQQEISTFDSNNHYDSQNRNTNGSLSDDQEQIVNLFKMDIHHVIHGLKIKVKPEVELAASFGALDTSVGSSAMSIFQNHTCVVKL